jgi:elongation of very long chain fatty acids protein 6
MWCRPPEESYADNATGLWCVVFTLSKLAELLDTAFVVLRKKELIFLHW